MAKKQINYDLKATKELFKEYLSKGTDKKQVQSSTRSAVCGLCTHKNRERHKPRVYACNVC